MIYSETPAAKHKLATINVHLLQIANSMGLDGSKIYVAATIAKWCIWSAVGLNYMRVTVMGYERSKKNSMKLQRS